MKCQAITQFVVVNGDPSNGGERCKFAASMSVGGKHLCTTHAKVEALSILIEEKRAVEHFPKQRSDYQPVRTE